MCSYPKKKRSGWTVEEYEFDDPKPEAPLVTLEAADGEERVRIDRTEPDIIDAPKPDWD